MEKLWPFTASVSSCNSFAAHVIDAWNEIHAHRVSVTRSLSRIPLRYNVTQSWYDRERIGLRTRSETAKIHGFVESQVVQLRTRESSQLLSNL